MSEEVVTVFRLVGRKEPKNPQPGEGYKLDLLIQPMMVREGSDEAQESAGAQAGLGQKVQAQAQRLGP